LIVIPGRHDVAVGYRAKLGERARELRAQAWTINEIVADLGVSKSSVSVWVRDVEFDEATRAARAGANRIRGARTRRSHRQQQHKQTEIERLLGEGRERIGELSDRDLLIAGAALYAPSIRTSRHPRGCLCLLLLLGGPPRDHGPRPCAVRLRGLPVRGSTTGSAIGC
jgi:hypothetical protein